MLRHTGARRAWGYYAKKNPELRNFKMTITPVTVRGKKFWRVAATGLDGRGAGGLCSKVKSRGGVCFAYSTIAHAGFQLLGFVAATPAGYSAAMFYSIVYAVTAMGAITAASTEIAVESIAMGSSCRQSVAVALSDPVKNWHTNVLMCQ